MTRCDRGTRSILEQFSKIFAQLTDSRTRLKPSYNCESNRTAGSRTVQNRIFEPHLLIPNERNSIVSRVRHSLRTALRLAGFRILPCSHSPPKNSMVLLWFEPFFAQN